MHIVIHYIALDAVVNLQTLHQVIVHLLVHVCLVWSGKVSYQHTYQDNDAEDEYAAQTAAGKLLCKRLVGSVIGVVVNVSLIHTFFVLDLIIVYEVHKLLTGLSLIKGTAEVACCSNAILFLHTAHLHAHVFGLDHHHHA